MEVLERYGDRIAYWRSEPDRGIYDAMNKGLRHAQGDIAGFLNADDEYFDEGSLEAIAEVFSDFSFIRGEACIKLLQPSFPRLFIHVGDNILGKIQHAVKVPAGHVQQSSQY